MTDKPNIIEKLYKLENDELPVKEREFRVCLEQVLERFLNRDVIRGYFGLETWIDCNV